MEMNEILSLIRDFGMPTVFCVFLGWIMLKKIQPIADTLVKITTTLDKIVDRLDRMENRLDKIEECERK